MSERSYGYAPTQLSGVLSDGRPFYFRCRHGQWGLHVGEVGWIPNILGWPTWGAETLVASGNGDITDPDEVDALVDQHLGADWRHTEPGEEIFTETCKECRRPFPSDGTNVCPECLSNLLGLGAK